MIDFDWSTPNWTVLVALMSAIFGAASRGLVGWWSSRNAALALNETAAQRVDRVAAEQVARAEAANVRLSQEIDSLWEQARGMDTWAHYYRHYCLNILQRWQTVLSVLDQLGESSISPGRAAGFAATLSARMPREPPPVPLLHEATKPPPKMFGGTEVQ